MDMQTHIGTDFDDFPAEEGTLIYQLRRIMREARISKVEMAKRMGTSRTALDRQPDPENPSVTLLTLERAANVPRQRLDITIAAQGDCPGRERT